MKSQKATVRRNRPYAVRVYEIALRWYRYVTVLYCIRYQASSHVIITDLSHLRGVVHCKDCMKPRCIYSMQAIANMKPPGEHTREEAIECRCVFANYAFYF